MVYVLVCFVNYKSPLLKRNVVFLKILARAKRQLLQNAGRPAADPTAGEDANSRKSHGSLAVWLLPPIVQLRGPCRPSTHK